jgi:hypothetical protein
MSKFMGFSSEEELREMLLEGEKLACSLTKLCTDCGNFLQRHKSIHYSNNTILRAAVINLSTLVSFFAQMSEKKPVKTDNELISRVMEKIQPVVNEVMADFIKDGTIICATTKPKGGEGDRFWKHE